MNVVFEPYQARAVAWLRTKRRGAVHAPAGSGKTIIAAGTLRSVIDAKPRPRLVRAGWIGNTEEHCDQAWKALCVVFDICTKQQTDGDVWRNGKAEFVAAVLTLVDVRVACAAAATDWSDRDVLIVDECHHAPAEGWAAQIASCHGTVWGFTATPPEGEDERLPAYTAIFGGEFFEIAREEVGSRLVQASVITLSATDYGLKDVIDSEIETAMAYRRRYWHTGEIAMCRRILADKSASDERKTAAVAMMEKLENQLWGQVAWQCCVKFGIVGNKLRTRAAVAKAVEHRRDSVIVLVNHVDHAEFVAGEIPGAVACYSKMGKKKRWDALEGFSGGRGPCIVATSLADEGLDVPRANVLVMVSAGRSNARTEQRAGRVCRVFANKQHAIVYDFADVFHPLAAKHSRVRHELYRKLGFQIGASARSPDGC